MKHQFSTVCQIRSPNLLCNQRIEDVSFLAYHSGLVEGETTSGWGTPTNQLVGRHKRTRLFQASTHHSPLSSAFSCTLRMAPDLPALYLVLVVLFSIVL